MNVYNKVSNADVMQSLNMLCVVTDKQLREVEKAIEKQLKLVDGEEGKRPLQKAIALIAYIGILPFCVH